MFNDNYWKKIKDIIKTFHLNFLHHTIGPKYLSKEELEYLEKRMGKEYLKLRGKELPYIDKVFFFGKIAQKIGLTNANKLSQKDILKYIKDHFEELNQGVESLDPIKKQTYLDILGKQYQVEKDLRQEIINQESKGEEVNFREFVKNIREKLGNWSDLQNSISYISESSLNLGKTEEIKQDFEDKGNDGEPLVYKVPLRDEKTCTNCKRAYLNSDGSPKIFKLSELEAYGTNIGLKPIDWKPTVGQLHPHCRCLLQYLDILPNTTLKDYIWSEGSQRYILGEEVTKKENKVQRRSKVKIQIGDKHFEV